MAARRTPPAPPGPILTPFRATLARIERTGGDLRIAWAGRARMASARQAANVPLDDDDLEALRRHPDPPMTAPRKPTP